MQAQATTWSDYKSHNTNGDRASDKHIVLDSGFLELLERDDQVMADRRFQINEDLPLKFCSLVVPPGARAKSQFTEEEEVKKTKQTSHGKGE